MNPPVSRRIPDEVRIVLRDGCKIIPLFRSNQCMIQNLIENKNTAVLNRRIVSILLKIGGKFQMYGNGSVWFDFDPAPLIARIVESGEMPKI